MTIFLIAPFIQALVTLLQLSFSLPIKNQYYLASVYLSFHPSIHPTIPPASLSARHPSIHPSTQPASQPMSREQRTVIAAAGEKPSIYRLITAPAEQRHTKGNKRVLERAHTQTHTHTNFRIRWQYRCPFLK